MINAIKNARKNTLKKYHLNTHEDAQSYDMIVFCHLRWQFVYQRPQHIISRMAETLKILFVEEPMEGSEPESPSNLMKVSDMLHVLQPHVNDIEAIADLLPKYLRNRNVAYGWFYSAAFCPLLEAVKFDTIIYDCMDELSLFKGAPTALIHQEKYLMAQADIIFTGGKSLYESKKQCHPNVHCYPSSVDQSHFAQALNGIAIPQDIASFKSPIVGYYGVIDERIDLELLAVVARKLPFVSFVMIGPVAKIEEKDLPQESNIHYLGMKSYHQLPHYLKAFNIAMMPFALNDATKYISPTKTLEYMAAGKPIISTKIMDVVRDYDICVSLIESADEFCEAITLLLDNTDHISMEIEYNRILKRTSWDATVDHMKSIMKTVAQ